MSTVYVVVLLATAVANVFAAIADWVPVQRIVNNASRLRLPISMLPLMGALKAAGAAGLLVGLAVPVIGTAAAVGLVLFFVLAVGAHLRAREYDLAWPVGFLTLSVATLLLGLVT